MATPKAAPPRKATAANRAAAEPPPSRQKAPILAGSGTSALASELQGDQPVSPELRQLMIRDAAYFRAEHRGFNGGDPEQDWREAEAEIDRMLHEGGADRSTFNA